MRVLCIGDVVGRVGRNMLFEYIDRLKNEKDLDLIIANGENAAHGRGITRNTYTELKRAGIDAVTLGNHSWDCYTEVKQIMDYADNIVRPANYSPDCPGEGAITVRAGNGADVGIINLIGQTFLPSSNSPFEAAAREIERLKKKTNIIFVDFHAEATSEKEAMGFYLDGKVSVVFGTHTHVQTADDCVLSGGTGYITDLGMTGPSNSVLGLDKDTVVNRFLNGLPQKYTIAETPGQLCGCVFDVDEKTGLCTGTERVYIKE